MAPRRIAIVGAGIAGLGAAWALSRHPERFDFRVYEANNRLGGNAVTVEMPQADGGSIPFDISVTACIPTVYQNYLQLLERLGVELVSTRFSYSVDYAGGVYAHDFDSELRRRLQPEIDKFQRLLSRLHRIGALSRVRSRFVNALNPFNYLSMGTVLNLGGFSFDFRYQVLKPMFVNFLLATNVFEMPAALFSRYLEFFDIEHATPMQTWQGGTRRIFRTMTSNFSDKIYLERPVRRVRRFDGGIEIEERSGRRERFDEVILACNANQALMILERPTLLERYILSSIRYESELHNHAIVHSDASVLPENATRPLRSRSNFIRQYGARPDNYELTHIMSNQQPWANASDRPCLVTYNPISPIDEEKIIGRHWFQHVVHDVRHMALLVNLFKVVQGRRRTWYCGAHTLINSQETCLVTGLVTARQIGADDPEARAVFNYYGRIMHDWRFRKA